MGEIEKQEKEHLKGEALILTKHEKLIKIAKECWLNVPKQEKEIEVVSDLGTPS